MRLKSCVSAVVIVNQKHQAECGAILSDIALKARKDPGCLRFVVYKDKDVAGRFAINEEWESEADLQHHLKTDHVLEVFRKIEALGGVIDNIWCQELI